MLEVGARRRISFMSGWMDRGRILDGFYMDDSIPKSRKEELAF